MSGESMNFLSELLLVQDIEVDGSVSFDKTSISGAITGKSDLCVVVKKDDDGDSITAITVKHSDDNSVFVDADDSVVKEGLPINSGLAYEKFGLKNDQLKKYVKITVTGVTATASFVIASKI